MAPSSTDGAAARSADDVAGDEIEVAILELAGARGSSKTICPSEVARHFAGADERQWRLLMKPVRARAVHLAREGRIEIRRKGRAVDPDNFKGVYRIAIAPPEDT